MKLKKNSKIELPKKFAVRSLKFFQFNKRILYVDIESNIILEEK